MTTALWILRGAFLVVAAGLGVAVMTSAAFEDAEASTQMLLFVAIILASLAIIVVDILLPRKRIELITCVYFGIVTP